MKTLKKYLLKKLAGLLILVLVLGLGWWGLRHFKPNWFRGQTEIQYEWVLKKFEKESQLVVGEAETTTLAHQTFTNDLLATWPDWTQPITQLFVSRNLELEIPIKTSFKVELAELTKADVLIQEGVLTFQKPLTVRVDSQQAGEIQINKSTSGLLDIAVDALTGSQKAQEFFAEKTLKTIAETSQAVMDDPTHQEKIAQWTAEAMTAFLNLGLEANQQLQVQIQVSDLIFVNEDGLN